MVRNGSGGDPILTSDVPRIIHALEALDLMTDATTVAVDDRPPVLPRLDALRKRLSIRRASHD
jgi:hypothetical protein